MSFRWAITANHCIRTLFLLALQPYSTYIHSNNSRRSISGAKHNAKKTFTIRLQPSHKCAIVTTDRNRPKQAYIYSHWPGASIAINLPFRRTSEQPRGKKKCNVQNCATKCNAKVCWSIHNYGSLLYIFGNTQFDSLVSTFIAFMRFYIYKCIHLSTKFKYNHASHHFMKTEMKCLSAFNGE